MDVNGEGRRPTRAQVAALGAKHGFARKRVDTIVEEIRAAVAGWRQFADAAGVTAASVQMFATAHQRVWADFELR
jgi:serine/threonine-protein kinase HipA